LEAPGPDVAEPIAGKECNYRGARLDIVSEERKMEAKEKKLKKK
jgi:hypothetical protein